MEAAELSQAIEAEVNALLAGVPARDDVQKTLNAYAGHIGMQDLTLDDDGAVQCLVDGDILLTFAHLPLLPGLVVAAPLSPEAASDDLVLRTLLKANMSWQETGGGVFMLVPPAMELMFCNLIPLAGGDPALLDRRVASFVDIVRDWYGELDLYLDGSDAEDDGEEAAIAFRDVTT